MHTLTHYISWPICPKKEEHFLVKPSFESADNISCIFLTRHLLTTKCPSACNILCSQISILSEIALNHRRWMSGLWNQPQFLLKNPNLWTLQRSEIQEYFLSKNSCPVFISNCWDTQIPWDLISGKETESTGHIEGSETSKPLKKWIILKAFFPVYLRLVAL